MDEEAYPLLRKLGILAKFADSYKPVRTKRRVSLGFIVIWKGKEADIIRFCAHCN
ncbi:hypothetical protein D3C80_1859450 [compost metagenome]